MAFSTKKKVKRIYILGAGVMQLPAIKAAKGFGWEVVCADGNSNAPGIVEADYFEHIDLRATEQIAESVFHWKKSRGLDGVFTAGTDFSACVATAAEKAGLPGVSLESALNATDKFRMRSVFLQKGVPSPRFEMIDSPLKKMAALQSVGLPLVIKPVDNMGARGIRRVDSEEQYNTAFQAALEHSCSGRIIVEEYLEGPEFSLDALVYKGDITICGIADRNIKFPPYFIETGHTMPTVFSREDQHRVEDVFIMGIKALGINNGAAKGDIKLTPRGAVVGEIAARLSGGYMSGWTYPLSSGVALTAAALKIAVGDPPGDLNPSKHHVSAERAFYSIPGIVESISGFEPELGEAAFLCVKPGDSVVFPRNNVEKCGNYIFSSRERNTAENLAEEACRNVIIRLKPGTRATLEFLKRKNEFWVPDAFSFKVQANRDWLSGLSPLPASGLNKGQSLEVPLPPELASEPECDWMGRNLKQALDRIISITGITLTRNQGNAGGQFWAAMLRGGIQGGLWYIDTLDQMYRHRLFKECFTLW